MIVDENPFHAHHGSFYPLCAAGEQGASRVCQFVQSVSSFLPSLLVGTVLLESVVDTHLRSV